MAGILQLKPEDEQRLHPDAVLWFHNRISAIQDEVPLEDLDEHDLNIFLSEDEKREFIECKDEITRGLITCVKQQESPDDLMSNASMQLNIIQFQLDSLSQMYRIQLLLKRVHQRKLAKAEQEGKKRDAEERRMRWTPSLGQDRDYTKSGFRYPQGVWC